MISIKWERWQRFIVLLLCLLATACGNEKEKNDQKLLGQPSKLEIKVVIVGSATISVPSPVEIAGVEVGQVVSKGLSKKGQPVLTLEIDPQYRGQLNNRIVFYQEENPDRLVGVFYDNAPKGGGVFLGFSSYARFLGWRTEILAAKTYKQAHEFVSGVLKDIKD